MNQGILDGRIEKTYRLVDEGFPLAATLAGVHLYDDRLDSYDSGHIESLATDLKSMADMLRQLPFHHLGLPERVELLLALREILEKLVFLKLSRPWEYDPHMYLVPLLSALFAMSSRCCAAPQERGFLVAKRLEGYPAALRNAQDLLKPLSRVHLERAIPLITAAAMYIQELFRELGTLIPRHGEALEALHAIIQDSLRSFRMVLQQKHEQAPHAPYIPSPLLFPLTILCDTMEKWEPGEVIKRARRILDEECRYMKAMAGSRTWAELIGEARKRHPSPGFLHQAYRDSMARGLALSTAWLGSAGSGSLPVVIDTPPFMRLHYPVVSYASSGSMEERQETFLCLTPLYMNCSDDELLQQLGEHNHGRIEHASLHESFPGHHLHLIHGSRNPSMASRRTRARSSLEGWALFCEDVFEKEGHYSDDGLLALHEARLWRAARCLVENGLGSSMMSGDEAYEILASLPGSSSMVARHELTGILVNQGEASSYVMGSECLANLYTHFREAHPSLPTGDFGRLFLGTGTVPPAMAGVLMAIEAPDKLEATYDALSAGIEDVTGAGLP